MPQLWRRQYARCRRWSVTPRMRMKQHAGVVVAVVAALPTKQKEVKTQLPWLQPSAPPLLEMQLPALHGCATWPPALCSCAAQAPLPLASLTGEKKGKESKKKKIHAQKEAYP
jgi:hypothetical protein